MADLIEHMPKYYENSDTVKQIIFPIDRENLLMEDKIDSTVKEFVVSSASAYQLWRYEEEYGLPIDPQGLTLEERRSRVRAKMRMVGAVNKEMLKNVVSAWSNADVEIIEDYGNYTVIIEFVNQIGIPTNIADVYNAVNEIIPAHLIVAYIFKFRQHQELRGFTHQQLSVYTHGTIREGVI